MPQTCENWLGLVNSCIYYVWQTCEIHQALPHSGDFKAPRVIYVHQHKLDKLERPFWEYPPQ